MYYVYGLWVSSYIIMIFWGIKCLWDPCYKYSMLQFVMDKWYLCFFCMVIMMSLFNEQKILSVTPVRPSFSPWHDYRGAAAVNVFRRQRHCSSPASPLSLSTHSFLVHLLHFSLFCSCVQNLAPCYGFSSISIWGSLFETNHWSLRWEVPAGWLVWFFVSMWPLAVLVL